MIFIALGTQKFQFNRLLEEIDYLLEQDIIKDQVFAQIGFSTYQPKKYDFCEFLSQNEYNEKLEAADLVISHGGVGTLLTALKYNKKIIAVPRLEKYAEHIDDHQKDICFELEQKNYLYCCHKIEDLRDKIISIKTAEFKKYVPAKSNSIVSYLCEYLNS